MPEMERMYEIYDDHGHYKFQVGPDRDGMDMLEIRYYDSGETKPGQSILFTKEEGRLIAEAIEELLATEVPPAPEPPGDEE